MQFDCRVRLWKFLGLEPFTHPRPSGLPLQEAVQKQCVYEDDFGTPLLASIVIEPKGSTAITRWCTEFASNFLR